MSALYRMAEDKISSIEVLGYIETLDAVSL